MKKMIKILFLSLLTLAVSTPITPTKAAGYHKEECSYYLSKPKIAEIQMSYNTLKLKVSCSKGVSGITIQGFNEDGHVIRRDIAKEKLNNWITEKLDTGIKYILNIYSYEECVCGYRVYSEPTTLNVQLQLKNPKNFSVTMNNYNTKTYTLSWSKVSGAHGYNVYRAKGINSTYKKVYSLKTTSKTVKTKNDYTYAIRAYRKVNNKYVYSSYSYVEASWNKMIWATW